MENWILGHGFAGFLRKTEEIWVTTFKTKWETARAGDEILQAQGVMWKIRAAVSQQRRGLVDSYVPLF